MILENVNEDLSVIKQVMALQNMKTAEATWSEYFDHPPEVASRQHMTAKNAWNDNATYRPIKDGL